MLERLILYRNELKNKTIHSYKLIGILLEILYSKEIFPKNKDIGAFLLEIFDVQYKDYVMRSRSLIVSRICKFLLTEKENKIYARKILKFVNSIISEHSITEQNGKDFLKGWVK